MLLTLIAAGTGVLNQLFKARTARTLIKREQARQKRLGRHIDLFI